MVMKFFVPLELHRNLERVGGVGGDRNGDNGEGDNEDDDDHGSSCPLSRCLPGTVLKTAHAWTPEASQQHQEVETICLCPGRLKPREAKS